MARGRMQGAAHQLRDLRNKSFRDGEYRLKMALDNRKSAQVYARKLEEYTWQVAFYDVDPPTEGWRVSQAASMRDNIPRLQGGVDRHWREAQRCEEAAAEHLATARKAGAALAHRERKLAPRQPPDLWVLLTVCWQGWLAQCGKRVAH